VKRILIAIAILVVLAILAAAAVFFMSREEATVPVEEGYGANPTLPEPNATLIPTVNIAEASPWPEGMAPTPAPGFAVTEFGKELDYPR
jgi:flagellar basal body-associated protein FliL